MKYKVVANDVLMIENVSALKALNNVMDIVKGHDGRERLRIAVYYLSGKETVGYIWKLENSIRLGDWK